MDKARLLGRTPANICVIHYVAIHPNPELSWGHTMLLIVLSLMSNMNIEDPVWRTFGIIQMLFLSVLGKFQLLCSTDELQGPVYMDEIIPLLEFYSMIPGLAVVRSKMLCEMKQMI